MGLTSFLELRIEHPLADFRTWDVLPSPESERVLAAQKVHMRFKNGVLLLRGDKNARVTPPKQKRNTLLFYLYSSDPNFLRVSDLPRFTPNSHLLYFSLVTSTGSLRKSGATVQVVPFAKGQQKKISATYSSFYGRPMPLLPITVVMVPMFTRAEPLRLALPIKGRSVYWKYMFSSCPEGTLGVNSSLGEFVPYKSDKAGTCTFISKEPLSIEVAAGTPGVSVGVSVHTAEGEKVLLEQLPGPDPNRLLWNAEMNNYVSTIRVDLKFRLSVLQAQPAAGKSRLTQNPKLRTLLQQPLHAREPVI